MKYPEVKVGQVWRWVKGDYTKYGLFRIKSVDTVRVHYVYEGNSIICGSEHSKAIADILVDAELVEDVDDKPNGQRWNYITYDELWKSGNLHELAQSLLKKETKMEKPKTVNEKKAVKEGKSRYIEDMMTVKSNEAKLAMEQFVSIENKARDLRKQADELRDVLGVTDAEMKQIFE